MKNAINYYYNLVSNNIHQSNKNYFFTVENSKYILYECNNIDEINEIYKLSALLIHNRFPYHQIIINNQNKITTIINESNYILFKINCEIYEININEILKNNIYINENIIKSKRKEWYELWTHKIDYLEYQYNQNKKNLRNIKDSFNYYIGMAETAISLAQHIKVGTKTIGHKRINYKDTTLELYNPLNLIFDYKVRDICEYFKTKFFYDNLNYDDIIFYLNTLNHNDIYIFFTRMFFPSYYFDILEKMIDKNEYDKKIEKIILKTEEYEELLLYIYKYIKQIININEIEWLTKNVG